MHVWPFLHWIQLVIVASETLQLTSLSKTEYVKLNRRKRIVIRPRPPQEKSRENSGVQTPKFPQPEQTGNATYPLLPVPSNDTNKSNKTNIKGAGDEEEYDYPAATFNRPHLTEVEWRKSNAPKKIKTDDASTDAQEVEIQEKVDKRPARPRSRALLVLPMSLVK